MRAFFSEAVPLDVAWGWADTLWEEKRARILRLRREEGKALALTAHRLLCYALKSVYGIMPTPADFGVAAHGKPFLKHREDIHFNISHSGTKTMCVLHDSPAGADIERIRPVGAGVAERIMSHEEHRAYLDEAGSEPLFFKVWTLKEAYIKYCGTGLSENLGAFTVLPAGGSITTDTGCAFWLIDDIPGYQAAVCAQDEARLTVENVGTEALAAF